MDPEDHEDDRPVDLEEFLTFVTVDSLMKLMDTRMWHSALSARACGRTRAQHDMTLLGKMVLEIFRRSQGRAGSARPSQRIRLPGRHLVAAVWHLWRSIKLYRR